MGARSVVFYTHCTVRQLAVGPGLRTQAYLVGRVRCI